MAIAWTMDKLGPMCRTADDCGLVLSAIAGHDPKDYDSLPQHLAAFSYSDSGSRELRIGKITNAWRKLPADLENAVDSALHVLEQHGATVRDVRIPDGAYEEAAELTILIEAASSFQSSSNRESAPNSMILWVASTAIPVWNFRPTIICKCRESADFFRRMSTNFSRSLTY